MIRVWRPWQPVRVGDVYQPVARVLKVRKGRPTVIEIDGERYVWMPRSMYMGPGAKHGASGGGGNRPAEGNADGMAG
ncbi:hypothetical protein Tmar_0032 [Thermaerobacter marianensis DSM 12885]|uniref:Uncharacterized protein n=1 Tax=Thermaerobacter marianensis (strain ATCC 700841 / DSM 12885 / JCM 10246 / 7p75a) TaxID=644966 RepID=E6SKH0_THEM7|nr:hypothetical protein [Thermaerobacter marianensis]ADU50157.1 hypothetical protein Tmar_0032 [Thermaerobacter marianensis DSM 12885]